MGENSLPHSHTGGVKPMNIQGRFARDRERLTTDFTDADREWRKKWINDQNLSPNEPRKVPELERALKNPFRRFYRYPMDYLMARLEPTLGQPTAAAIRWIGPKLCFVYIAGLVILYNKKYNHHDWTRHSGLNIKESRPDVLPGDYGYPKVSDRVKPRDYADYGFQERKVLHWLSQRRHAIVKLQQGSINKLAKVAIT